MKFLVLGGGGFIGSAIVDQLLVAGHSVRVFERPRVVPYRAFERSELVEWTTGDLLSTSDMSRALAGVDTVLHLVSTTLPKSSNDDPVYDVQSNVVGTLQILNLMAKMRTPRIVFISSGGTVYGPPEYMPIDEKHPTSPQVSYGITKLAIEKYILLYERMYGIKSIILRLSNPYGERQRIETAQGAIAVFLQLAMQGRALEIWGDGSVTRDYVYIEDVAEAFVRAAEYQGPISVFNIGSGRGTSLNELIALIEKVLDRTVERQYLPSRPFDVKLNVLDNTLAQRELGWIPRVELGEGLARTTEWIRRSLPRI